MCGDKDSKPRDFKPDLESFEQVFAQVQAKILSGELRKAVPFVVWRSEGRPLPEEVSHWKSRAFARKDLGKPYAFVEGARGSIGVTPELLFELHVREGWLKTAALAGTCGDPSEWNGKLQGEHELVIEGLVERLALGAKRVDVGAFQLVPYGSLWHGRTEIRACELADIDPEAWIRRLHPTAAIGVLPYGGPEALAFLGPRRAFGTPFWEAMEDGRIEAWVQIRGVEWDEAGVTVTCGVGVTAESRLEDEISEAFAKFKNVAGVLGLTADVPRT